MGVRFYSFPSDSLHAWFSPPKAKKGHYVKTPIFVLKVEFNPPKSVKSK